MINPWKDYTETAEYRISPGGTDVAHGSIKTIPLNVYEAYYNVFFRDICGDSSYTQMEERLKLLCGDWAEMVNILFHYLYTEDRNNSITPCYIFKAFCENLILREDAFGGKVKTLYCGISEKHRNTILFYMAQKYVRDCGESLFEDVVAELFRSARLIPTTEKWIFWTSEPGSTQNRDALALCESLFLDLGETVDSYWGAPVGILGEPMRIGGVQAVYPLED